MSTNTNHLQMCPVCDSDRWLCVEWYDKGLIKLVWALHQLLHYYSSMPLVMLEKLEKQNENHKVSSKY